MATWQTGTDDFQGRRTCQLRLELTVDLAAVAELGEDVAGWLA